MGPRVNLLFQRRITHTYPRSAERLAAVVARGKRHVEALRGAGLDPARSTFFEFGAGWDLAVPLTMAALGAGRQVVIDLHPLLRLDLVSDVARRIAEDHEALGLPMPSPDILHDGEAALATRRIDYRAPCDARQTGLEPGSFDVVSSTSTLEHIPTEEIGAILQESRRILRPGGMLSFEIDYSDHYSHGDRSIGPYNFLQFSETEWGRLSPSLHHQNRLRHSDYQTMFDAAGFELVDVDSGRPDQQRRADLDDLRLAPHFDTYDKDDLSILEGWFLLRRP